MSDFFGRKWILIIGLFCTLLSFIPLIFTQTLSFYLLLLIGVSLGKGLIQTLFKAKISDNIKDLKTRETAFYLFYFFVNVGGVVGPILGVNYALTSPGITFSIISIVYICYIAFCITTITNDKPYFNAEEEVYSIKKCLMIIKSDYAFISLIVANLFIMLIYAQVETTLAQYFSRHNAASLITLFSYLIVTNAAFVILFQFPFLKFISKYRHQTQVYIGITLLAASQVVFALTQVQFYYGWFTGIIILSFGEIILFSVLNVQIDRLAPKNLRGAYFGASTLCMIGFIFAPYLGGLLLELFGRTILFIVMAVLCIVVFICYKNAIFQHKKLSNSKCKRSMDPSVQA